MSAAPVPPLASPRPPAWATSLVARSAPDVSGLPAAFAAGAALASLDILVNRNAPFAGGWRLRLALKATVASLEGRAGDEASLRDAHALTRPGGDPGPAGRVYAAWRALASGRRLADVAVDLGGPPDPEFINAILDVHARALAPAPFAAAVAATAIATRWPRAIPLAFAVADGVLAARLGWRTPLPLLALESRARLPK